LIEGAHAGHGLGHEFLRHVERTHLLVHRVEAVPLDGSEPLANYRTIRQELVEYSPTLAERPELLVVTKLDVTGAVDAKGRIEQALGREVLGISAVTGQGIPQLLHRLAELLRRERRSPTEAPGARESVRAPASVLATPQGGGPSPSGSAAVSVPVSSSAAGS
jgi:GTP-binding protein